MQEVTSEQVFKQSLVMYKGNRKKAAFATLDAFTMGMTAAWDSERIEKAIKKIVEMFADIEYDPNYTINN